MCLCCLCSELLLDFLSYRPVDTHVHSDTMVTQTSQLSYRNHSNAPQKIIPPPLCSQQTSCFAHAVIDIALKFADPSRVLHKGAANKQNMPRGGTLFPRQKRCPIPSAEEKEEEHPWCHAAGMQRVREGSQAKTDARRLHVCYHSCACNFWEPCVPYLMDSTFSAFDL